MGRDAEVEQMIRGILEDQFAQTDIEVEAIGSWWSRERAVWLRRGRTRVPVIPLRCQYGEVDERRPPRLSEAIEDWRTSASHDLPRVISYALTELHRRNQRMMAA